MKWNLLKIKSKRFPLKYKIEKCDNPITTWKLFPSFNEDNIIDIPIISDGETIENANNGKCKQLTKKGKQCDYTAKPNSEFCGRHSK